MYRFRNSNESKCIDFEIELVGVFVNDDKGRVNAALFIKECISVIIDI